MKNGWLFPELLSSLGRAVSPEAGFARALRQLFTLSGAKSGGLCFLPLGGTPLVVTAGIRRGSGADAWIRARLVEPVTGTRLEPVEDPPPGRRHRRPVMLRVALGEARAPVGRLLLLGTGGRGGLSAEGISPGFAREFGLALE